MFGSLISGLLGVGSNLLGTSLNQSNFEDQMNFSRYQYQDMRERQDPKYQVKRMRAAGLNPALNAGNIAMGQTSSVSQPSPNPANVLDVGGLASIGNQLDLNVLTAENIRSQTHKNELESEGLNVDNIFKAENWKSLIYGRDAESWLKNQLSDAAKLDVQFNKLSMKNRLLKLQYDTELADAQVVAQDLINHYLPSRLPAEVNKLISEQFANYATGRASLRMASQNLMEIYSKYGGTPELRQKFFNATLDGLIQSKSESESRERANDRVQTPFSFGPGGLRYDNVYTYNKKTGDYDRR